MKQWYALATAMSTKAVAEALKLKLKEIGYEQYLGKVAVAEAMPGYILVELDLSSKVVYYTVK